MALPTDEKVYNMSTQYRRRKDLIVTELPSGELVVMERCRYYPPRLPKPQQAVTVLPPLPRPQAVTVLPPPRKPLTITITMTTTRITNREDPPPFDPSLAFLTALFNFLSKK